MPARFMCQCACVPTCQKRAKVSFLRSNLSYSVPIFNLECQRAKWYANFSSWMPAYQNACQFFKHYFYEMLSEHLYFIIIQKILHFTWYHSFTYHTFFFIFFFLFCSLVRNSDIQRPCFYTLQVTRIFSSEYCDLHELWSAWDGDTI